MRQPLLWLPLCLCSNSHGSPELQDKKGAFQSGSLGGSKSVEAGGRCVCVAQAQPSAGYVSSAICCRQHQQRRRICPSTRQPPLPSVTRALTAPSRRNLKLISERSAALARYFSQLCALPQVVASQPFQSFFEVLLNTAAAADGARLGCFCCCLRLAFWGVFGDRGGGMPVAVGASWSRVQCADARCREQRPTLLHAAIGRRRMEIQVPLRAFADTSALDEINICVVRWENQFASCNAKKKKIRFLQVSRHFPYN